MKEDMELTQEDLLGDNNNNNNQPNELEKENVSKSKKKDVPFGYIPITLDSCGKLTAPEVLHFRDFTPEELSHIALSKNKRDNIKRITDCLNKMVFENFDCTYLHLDDALKIVLTLYGSFYMSTIEKEYYINPDIEDEEKLNEDSNIGKAIIPISNIETVTIPESFKEPFDCSMEINGKKMTTLLRLLRVKDYIEADDYVSKLFDKDIRQLANIEIEIEKVKAIEDTKERINAYFDIPEEDRITYEKFSEDYETTYISVLTSMPVIQVGSMKPKTIPEKIKAAKVINRGQWKKYNEWTEENFFGNKPEVKFFSIELQEEITRRFYFQLDDFIIPTQ